MISEQREQSSLLTLNKGQATPLYNNYTLLTIKNPNNQASQLDLLRVLHHLKDIVGFSTIFKKCFETGKQNQKHIHAIIKKKYPTDDLIKKYSSIYKLKKLKYLEPVQSGEDSEEPELIEQTIDTKQFTWRLTNITDNAHFNQLRYEYMEKELVKKCHFID